MKKITLLFVILITLLSFVYSIKKVSAQTYTVYSEISNTYPNNVLPSNTVCRLTARVTPIPQGSIQIDFLPQWRSMPSSNTTDLNGRAYVDVLTPISTAGNTYTIIISSPSQLFATITVTVTIKLGVKVDLEYNSKQYFDPESQEDIILYVYPKETDSSTSYDVSTWNVIAVSSQYTLSGAVILPPVEPGKYKVIFSTDSANDYTVTISATKTNNVAVPSKVTIILGNPVFCVKATIGSVSSWVGYDPAGNVISQALDITRGTEGATITFYNSKEQLTSPDPQIGYLDFIVETASGQTLSWSQGTLTVSKQTDSSYLIYLTFDETSYDLRVKARRGIAFQPFDKTLKLSTVGHGIDWLSFLYSPMGLLLILIVIAVIAFLVKRDKSKQMIIIPKKAGA